MEGTNFPPIFHSFRKLFLFLFHSKHRKGLTFLSQTFNSANQTKLSQFHEQFPRPITKGKACRYDSYEHLSTSSAQLIIITAIQHVVIASLPLTARNSEFGFTSEESASMFIHEGFVCLPVTSISTIFPHVVSRTHMYLSDPIVTCVEFINFLSILNLVSYNQNIQVEQETMSAKKKKKVHVISYWAYRASNRKRELTLKTSLMVIGELFAAAMVAQDNSESNNWIYVPMRLIEPWIVDRMKCTI